MPEVIVIVRTFLSAAAVVTIPLAVVGAQEPAKSTDPSAKRICEVVKPTGSRLGGVRRCRTEAEREEHQREARQVVDRIQAMKPTMCPPVC